jgi:hypothetical protein
MSDDRAAFEGLARVIVPSSACVLQHDLYLPGREDTAAGGEWLRAKWFRNEERRGADGQLARIDAAQDCSIS